MFATAALLPNRVAAAAALAPLAPFGAEGLAFYEGMGAQNIEDFHAIFEGEQAHLVSPEDGHITLTERRMPEVHAWLLAHFDR